MNEPIIYTDNCCPKLEKKLADETGTLILRRFAEKDWNISNTMKIITTPSLVLAVLNKVDDIALMEISLLNFMCKPIVITSKSVELYPVVCRTVDFINSELSLIVENSNFINWYKEWKNKNGIKNFSEC